LLLQEQSVLLGFPVGQHQVIRYQRTDQINQTLRNHHQQRHSPATTTRTQQLPLRYQQKYSGEAVQGQGRMRGILQTCSQEADRFRSTHQEDRSVSVLIGHRLPHWFVEQTQRVYQKLRVLCQQSGQSSHQTHEGRDLSV
jgi:hypothetical protein